MRWVPYIVVDGRGTIVETGMTKPDLLSTAPLRSGTTRYPVSYEARLLIEVRGVSKCFALATDETPPEGAELMFRDGPSQMFIYGRMLA